MNKKMHVISDIICVRGSEIDTGRKNPISRFKLRKKIKTFENAFNRKDLVGKERNLLEKRIKAIKLREPRTTNDLRFHSKY